MVSWIQKLKKFTRIWKVGKKCIWNWLGQHGVQTNVVWVLGSKC
jgi:hypothetical protein